MCVCVCYWFLVILVLVSSEADSETRGLGESYILGRWSQEAQWRTEEVALDVYVTVPSNEAAFHWAPYAKLRRMCFRMAPCPLLSWSWGNWDVNLPLVSPSMVEVSSQLAACPACWQRNLSPPVKASRRKMRKTWGTWDTCLLVTSCAGQGGMGESIHSMCYPSFRF